MCWVVCSAATAPQDAEVELIDIAILVEVRVLTVGSRRTKAPASRVRILCVDSVPVQLEDPGAD